MQKAFAKAYKYASTQTQAISALSKTTPEEMYYAVDAILQGMGISLDDVSSFIEDIPDVNANIEGNFYSEEEDEL